MRPIVLLTFAALVFPGVVLAETVTVKYRGPVSLDTFECQDVTDSSFIERVCFDQANSYMVISLSGTYYHYCEIGQDVVQGLLTATSKGRFFNTEIKGSGTDNRYDCRTHAIPEY